MPEKDVEDLLVSLILDNRIDGHIDQVNGLLECRDRSVHNPSTYHCLFSQRCLILATNLFYMTRLRTDQKG